MTNNLEQMQYLVKTLDTNRNSDCGKYCLVLESVDRKQLFFDDNQAKDIVNCEISFNGGRLFAVEAKEQTSGTIMSIEADKLESGTAFALNADKLTTGSALIVRSNSDDEVGRRSIVKFEATHENAGNAQVLNLVQKGYLHRWSNQSHKPGSPLAIES
jgi:hypothetical protein